MAKGFDWKKYDAAVSKQEQKCRTEQFKPDREFDMQWYQCWECDKKYGQGEFVIPGLIFDLTIKCPRHPTHRDIEFMGRGHMAVKWDKGSRS